MAEAFQQAIKVWQDIGLSNLQKTLDEQGVKISEFQSAGVANRRDLSVKTKEFKRLDESEKLVGMKALLKLYQAEIDNLTNRCKYSESCFMNVYKLMADAPDPQPLLEASADSVQQALELSSLQEKNSKLEKQLVKFSDYDKVKSKLVDLEMRQAQVTAEKVTAKQQEIEAIWDEKQKAWQSKERDLQVRVTELKGELNVALAQLSNQSSRDFTDTDLKLAELNSTARELEKASLKIAQLESRNVDLRKELETAKSGTGALELRQTYDAKIAQLESDNDVLTAQINSVRKQFGTQIELAHKKAAGLEASLQVTNAELLAAKTILAQQQDYEQIKKEVAVLRAVEFGDDDIVLESNGYEEVLQLKNTKLNDELVALRVQHEKTHTENIALRESVKLLEDRVNSSRDLIEKLENDLAALHSEDTFSSVSGWTPIPRKLSPVSSISSRSNHAQTPLGPPSNHGAAQHPSADMLAIITQQRDRFRERVQTLEEDLHKATLAIGSLNKELEAVKQDNLELYQRSRYVQQTSNKSSNRLRGAYEEGLSAYQQFKSLETERAMVGMSAVDRVIFSIFRKALLEPKFRYGSLLYIGALHLAVLFMVL